MIRIELNFMNDGLSPIASYLCFREPPLFAPVLLPDEGFVDVRPADFVADPADPFFAVVFGDLAPSLAFPLLLELDLAWVVPAFDVLPAAVLFLLEDELLPDLAFPPVLAADERDVVFADFDAPDELDPLRLLVESDEVDLDFVDFEADDFFVDDAEEAFEGALAAPELFLAEDPLVVFPTVLTTAFAVPTAAPVAAPCRISPTTSFALS